MFYNKILVCVIWSYENGLSRKMSQSDLLTAFYFNKKEIEEGRK